MSKIKKWEDAPDKATHINCNEYCNILGCWDNDGIFIPWASPFTIPPTHWIPRPTEKWQPPHIEADDVNHPSHYQLGGGLESIDVIRATLTPEQFKGFCLGNLLKYRLRAGEKGDALQDIAKADWYKKELGK